MTILDFLLSIQMEVPTLFGWFHILCLVLTIVILILIYKYRNKLNEKLIYGLFGFGSLILEIIKQYMWNFNFVDGELVFSYGWYNFPFQLCSTPMYVAIALFFLNDTKLKKCLINYLSYFTIISSLAVCIYPVLVFSEYTIVNIQTMYLHCGSLIVSLYLIFSNKMDKGIKGLVKGLYVFLVFVLIALVLDIGLYNLGLIGEGQEFNMFYISPYYKCVIPGLSQIQEIVPYPIFLLVYILSLTLAAYIVNRIVSIKKDN